MRCGVEPRCSRTGPRAPMTTCIHSLRPTVFAITSLDIWFRFLSRLRGLPGLGRCSGVLVLALLMRWSWGGLVMRVLGLRHVADLSNRRLPDGERHCCRSYPEIDQQSVEGVTRSDLYNSTTKSEQALPLEQQLMSRGESKHRASKGYSCLVTSLHRIRWGRACVKEDTRAQQ